MSLSQQLAQHAHQLYFGGNATGVNYQDQLADVTWQQANEQVYDLNTIVALVFHQHYYVKGVSEVLQGGPLRIRDKFSYDHPSINSAEDWSDILDDVWASAETFAQLIEQLPEEALTADFADGKYGNNYRNLAGTIEHCHYHLGQIVLIKKILAKRAD